MSFIDLGFGVEVNSATVSDKMGAIFTPGLVRILSKFHTSFNEERVDLLEKRRVRQIKFDAGELPSYQDSKHICSKTSWEIAPLPEDIKKRRVEITGPVHSTKMVINMLNRNSFGERADTAMLDFEDSMKPSWFNVVNGVLNVMGAVRKDLVVETEKKTYQLNPNDMAKVMVRVRGLHLEEANVKVNGENISAGMFDLLACFFHTFRTLVDRGETPLFYIPKCEHYEEARFWNTLFSALEYEFDLKRSTIRSTFLIETLPAAFQMEEILYEIKDHAAGLNGGRWDKIFSDIKVLRKHKQFVLADRSTIDMKKYWMDNYAKRLIRVCHSHGAFAIGGMSAFTPGNTKEIREAQTKKVVEDKQYESSIGHDGCWVSHPYFIGFALKQFPNKNQLSVQNKDFPLHPELLPSADGPKTLEGLRKNIRVGIAYQEGWNRDIGCVSWDGLMEDLATFEISRAQVWQWKYHEVTLDSGLQVTEDLIRTIFNDELTKIIWELKQQLEPHSTLYLETVTRYRKAKEDAVELFLEHELRPFLTETSILATETKTAHINKSV